MNYFIHDERDLSPAYVASCRKFFKSLKPQAKKWKLNKFTMNEDVYIEDKQQASSRKPQKSHN